MNILEAEDIIKGLPDDALMQESEMPTGQLPQFLVVSEIQRRSDMRNRYSQQMQEQPQGTVADQIKQQGIMSMMPQMGAPQMGMPQMGMPPQMMSAGGIVKLANGGFLDQPTPMGSTVRDQLDAMIASGMSYADMLAFVSRTFPGRPEVTSYVQSKARQSEMPPDIMQASMIPEMREVLDREPYESKEARMPMLAGGSDIYKAPMILRAADALGLFDSYKSKPEPERMAEPMASALARQLESEYATPDLSQRLTADMLTGADPVPSRGASMPSRARPSMGFGGIFDGVGESDALNKLQQIGGGIADMFGAVGDSMPESAGDSLLGRLTAASQESAIRDPDRYTREEALPYSGTKAGTEQNDVATAVEAVTESTPRNDASSQDFSFMDQFFDDVASGDITVQGRSPVQAQGVPSPAEPPPTNDPDFSIADLIADQRRMTQANMLMQLGAGIAGGDVSKGLSAAGMAGMKGSQAEQALALKERLAKYQAGRQDIARAEKAAQFEKTFGLSEQKLEALIQQNADTTKRELLRTLVAQFEAELDQVKRAQYASQIQQIIDELRGGSMAVGGMQGGTRSREDILNQYLGS